jgi:RimK family alpha-L-glutamate ligase
LKIPIFTDDPGWHGKQLKQAFDQHGVEAVYVSLQQCVIDLSQQKPTIKIPGFNALPQAAFVRGVSGGTLQQIITRLNVLHIMAMSGVRVYNDAKAIERTVDKGLTSYLLQSHGVQTPQTWVCESRHEADTIRQAATTKNQLLVIKPLFGSQGLGVRQLDAIQPLPVPMERFVDGVYYLQALINTAGKPHDYRLFVINNQVVASMKRTGGHWLNNVAAGGRCEAVQPNQALLDIAVNAVKALDIAYAGVDIIQAESGEYFVLEVNSIPAWRGLQGATQLNVAELLVDDFLRT